MRAKHYPDFDIETDGRTVWVNGHDGFCWGRFSLMGIDVHGNAYDQKAGKHCLDCQRGPCTVDHWQQFRNSMRNHHRVEVPDNFMPRSIAA